PDDVEQLKSARAPLSTLESQTPVAQFPVIAFSVAYELELQGLFTILDLAKIPLLREERGPQHPLLVAGGPLSFSNPDPLEPFVDVLVQGEADELVHVLMDQVASLPRDELLAALARTPGFRIPGLGAGPRYFVAKAVDERLPARSQIITPNTELRSMFLIE